MNSDTLKGSYLEKDVKLRMTNWADAAIEKEEEISRLRKEIASLKKDINNEIKSWE